MREKARLTHATYDNGKFTKDNSGQFALPNGRDLKVIEDLPKLGGFIDDAFFGKRGGSVHVIVENSMTHAAHKFMHGRGYTNHRVLLNYGEKVEIVFW